MPRTFTLTPSVKKIVDQVIVLNLSGWIKDNTLGDKLILDTLNNKSIVKTEDDYYKLLQTAYSGSAMRVFKNKWQIRYEM